MAFESDRPDPRPFLRSIQRRRWLLAAVIVGIPAVVFVLSMLPPKQYEATATLQVQAPSAESAALSNQLSPPPSAQDAARLVETTTVAEAAARRLEEPPGSAGELLESVSALAEAGASFESPQILTITAQADSAERAAEIANAFAQGLRNVLVKQAIESVDAALEALRAGSEPDSRGARRALDNEIQQLEAFRAGRPSSLQVVEPAFAPSGPSSPKPLVNAVLAFILSVLLAGALVPLLDRLDRDVHDPDELEDLSESRLLATVPSSAFARSPSATDREPFQTLRTSLTYFNVDRPISSVLVASPGAGDGKTTVAMSLASAMARAEMEVLLVDGDLRTSPIAGRVGASGRHGLSSILLDGVDPGDAIESVDVGGVPLRVLSGGDPVADPPALLGSERMRRLLDELESDTDVVVVDTPPILAVSDAVPLLREVSGVLLVGRLEHTTREGFWRAARLIRSAHGTILGAVATGVPDSLRTSYGAEYPRAEARAGGVGVRSSSSV